MLLRCLEHWLMLYWPELSVPPERSFILGTCWFCGVEMCVCVFSVFPLLIFYKNSHCQNASIQMFYCTSVLSPRTSSCPLWLCCCGAGGRQASCVVDCRKQPCRKLNYLWWFCVRVLWSFPQVPEGKRFAGRDNTYFTHACSCLVDLVLTSVTNHTRVYLLFVSQLSPYLVKQLLVSLNLV